MNTSEWFGRKVAGWLPVAKGDKSAAKVAAEAKSKTSSAMAEDAALHGRSSKERLNAKLRHKEEAL